MIYHIKKLNFGYTICFMILLNSSNSCLRLRWQVKSLHRVMLRERRSKHVDKTTQLLRQAREKATLSSAQKEKNWSLVDLRGAVQDHIRVP